MRVPGVSKELIHALRMTDNERGRGEGREPTRERERQGNKREVTRERSNEMEECVRERRREGGSQLDS